jgi:probable phosphoglycerate mutase
MLGLPLWPFYFVRHGQTDFNAQGLSQGAIDIPLNEVGRAQAEAAAPVLAGRGIVGIATSPMLRAHETATIINATLNLPMMVEPDLREVIFGGQEGKPLVPWFSGWLDGTLTPEGAESFEALTERAASVMARVLAHPGPLLIVSHGAFFRSVRALMGLELDVISGNARPMFCAPMGRIWQATPLT